jgi:catechol 2,3-dioxygenase
MNTSSHTSAEVPSFGIRPPTFRLPDNTTLGCVRLAVSNLQRALHFYSEVVGLALLEQTGTLARLGAHQSIRLLLELEELPGVHPIGRKLRLGLYHTAFLLPTRSDLSSFVQHLQHIGVPFGAGDHLYSEAVYLTDPDGLSVEVYADRPYSEWKVEDGELLTGVGEVRFNTFPKVEENSWQGAPADTVMGHVHFYVGDLESARAFYHRGLGLDITTWRFPGALFTSAGGYHHHVGLNVWVAKSPPANASESRLLFWELCVPSAIDVQHATESMFRAGYHPERRADGVLFRDPWGITVSVKVQDRNK